MSSTDGRSYADVAAQPSSDPDPDPVQSPTAAPALAAAPADGLTDGPAEEATTAGTGLQPTSPKSALAKTRRIATPKTAHFDLPVTPEAGAGSGEGSTSSRAEAPPQPDQNEPGQRGGGGGGNPHQSGLSSSPPRLPLHHLPVPPDLHHTAQDLKQLIKGFIFLPAFIRKFRTLIPEPVRVLARRAIRLLAMVLHKQGKPTVDHLAATGSNGRWSGLSGPSFVID